MGSTNLIAIPERRELGPACRELTAKMLRFAIALYQVPAGPGAPVAAAVLAGYSASTEAKLAEDASRLAADPRVVAAVEELARQRLTLDVPLALQTLRDAMTERYGKDKVRAAQQILDRVVPTKQELKVAVEQKDQVTVTLDLLAHMLSVGTPRNVLEREFGPGGLITYERLLKEREAAQAEKNKTIEGEFTVLADENPTEPSQLVTVENDLDDSLEDLL